MSPTTVALLLFGSGTCALVYQVAWLRALRLVFGASTAATAAVLAIFMGGLGVGGAILGRRADRHPNPLRLYAHLELGISVCAALTPFLVVVARQVYVGAGGSEALGMAGATAVRLVLSTLILGLPTFLMGGTLPAAAKAVETEVDVGRRRLAMLYGTNTMGAVFGAMLATFFLLEVFGTRTSLWLACLLNLLVAVCARSVARSFKGGQEGDDQEVGGEAVEATAPPSFVYPAAGIVGLVFLLMELVWYRMLSPLLGGSTYTFGLILAVALLGIGLGGGLYALRQTAAQPTLRLFALTCGLEGLCFAVPYALGDRLAILAALLHPLGGMGLAAQVAGWSIVTSIVVLPGAVVAGFQFPLLIGLLGRGGRDVGEHTGFAYAWNTAGAIAGSLAGGFVLLPLLTATGCWQLAVLLLAVLGGAAALLSAIGERRRLMLAWPVAAALCSLALLQAAGPTAAWRQSPIGAGRVDLAHRGRNEIRDWLHAQRRGIVWETEGVESSVGLSGVSGLAFILNGKVDGNARWDAPTQVMLGVVGAALHPEPRTAMVLGLGTGSSAGWLAAIDTVDRVDVAELEPGILEVARRCAPVNRNVMENPKVRVIVGDGREFLQTTTERYDVIASAPSNPYRAGIASLYTVEFYRAVAARLGPGGVFTQWVQAYEIDTRTVRTIFATLVAVFPVVEIWQTKTNDMLLVCGMEERAYSVPRLRQRLATEPYRSAALAVWGGTDLEGFLARYVAQASLCRAVAVEEQALGWLNTDDRMLVEFGFARTVGQRKVFNLVDAYLAARQRRQHRPRLVGGAVDWQRVGDNRLMMFTLDSQPVPPALAVSEAQQHRLRALDAFLAGDLGSVLEAWQQQPREPYYPLEVAMVAEALADSGDERALSLGDGLGQLWPAEADAIRARYHLRRGETAAAATALVASLELLRSDPWPHAILMQRALKLALAIAEEDPTQAERLYQILSVPFAVNILHDVRVDVLLDLAKTIDDRHAAAVLHRFEPHVPWTRTFLAHRYLCYQMVGDPLGEQAERDLEAFLAAEPVLFSETLR